MFIVSATLSSTNLWEVDRDWNVVRTSYFGGHFKEPPKDGFRFTITLNEPEENSNGIEGGSGARKQRRNKPKALKESAAWLPTNRTVKHKGVVRKLWKSAKDASVLAVKRVVKAADGSNKVRFQRV